MEQSVLTFDRSLVQELPKLTEAEMRVFFLLADQSVSGIKVGVTLNSLAREANVGRQAARDALDRLSQREPPLIRMTKRSKHYDIMIVAQWMAGQTVRFTYDDTDQRKIETAEREMRRMDIEHQKIRSGEFSGIADDLTGEDRGVILEIERRQGGLSPTNAYHIGKAMGQFGPARVRTSWRSVTSARNPIRAAVGKLINGAYGKEQAGAPNKEQRQPKYFEHS